MVPLALPLPNWNRQPIFGVDGIATVKLNFVEDGVVLEIELDLLADGEGELNNEFKFVPAIGMEVVDE